MGHGAQVTVAATGAADQSAQQIFTRVTPAFPCGLGAGGESALRFLENRHVDRGGMRPLVRLSAEPNAADMHGVA